nr:Bm2462 [Brugia malayi]
MASDIAKQFDIDKKEHRIAILEFSSKTILSKWLRYPFDRIKTNNDMEKVIQNLPHIHGTTDTGRALGIVLQEFFPQHRPGLLLLVFIITDGYYRDSEEVKQNVANLVAKPNVQLFVATASRLHNMQRNVPKTKKHFQDLRPKGDTLSEFAFRPIHFVSASSVRTANVSSSAVMSTTSTKDVVNIKPGCLFDVVFLMDFSGGVSDKRDIYIDYVSILIRSLDLNRTAVHVAAIYYSGPKRARTLFHLRKHSRAENAIKDLQRAPSNGGTTRTGEAIYYATNEFNEKFGARKDARKMIIIFTDGHSQDNPTEASRTARNKGIELKAVSIEDENIPPDTNQIIAITGDPSDAYSSKNFNKLQSFFDEYSRRCKL